MTDTGLQRIYLRNLRAAFKDISQLYRRTLDQLDPIVNVYSSRRLTLRCNMPNIGSDSRTRESRTMI